MRLRREQSLVTFTAVPSTTNKLGQCPANWSCPSLTHKAAAKRDRGERDHEGERDRKGETLPSLQYPRGNGSWQQNHQPTVESRALRGLDREGGLRVRLQFLLCLHFATESRDREKVEPFFWVKSGPKLPFFNPKSKLGKLRPNGGWAGLTESASPTGFDEFFPDLSTKQFCTLTNPLPQPVSSPTGWVGAVRFS